MAEIRDVAGDVHRRHVADGARAGDAQLLSRQAVRHQADHGDRRRRGDVRHGQRLWPVPAASGESQAARLSSCKNGGYDTIDHQASDPAKAMPRVADGGRRLGASAAEGRASRRRSSRRKARSTTIRSQQRRRRRPLRRDARRRASEGTDFDPAKEQHTGCVLGIGLCAYRDARRRRRLPRRCRATTSKISYPTAAQAAQGAQRRRSRSSTSTKAR